MKAIEIKTNFGDWRPVSEESARRYIKFLMSGAAGIPDKNRAEYIENRHLRGITVAELMEG